ncbi:MAG: T9SS type A sorting domain-containing protein [Saprospiraceae bacterium]|nr:T9SS type A sorting domain-containing protein [Saprospiraceae bacterium]MBK9726559.1 T9SS type A sorting domain-containing protein [Saprospiraceae bacterium]
MKEIFTLFAFLISSGISVAQEFGTSDSKWVFDYNGVWSEGITEIQFEKDTFIDNRLCKKFIKKALRRVRPKGPIESETLFPLYLYNKNGLIEFSEDGLHFDTLINFKAKIGQSWKIFRYYRNMIVDEIKLTIIDTFNTQISGVNLFSQAVWYYYSPQLTNFVDTVYEYIGGKWLYIIPFDDKEVALDAGEGGIIRCFKNNLLGLVDFANKQYGSKFEYECDDLTRINNKNVEIENPFIQIHLFHNYLNIKNNSKKDLILNIYNLQGQIVTRKLLDVGLNQINIEYLNNGIYIVLCENHITYKIIKN